MRYVGYLFQTDLKQIFNFIKYSKEKETLKKLVEEDSAYQNMAEEAYEMIAACTHAEELIALEKTHRKDGGIDMCQAIKEMLEDERKIGMERGARLFFIIQKKVKKNLPLDAIADDLEEDIEVIRPIYEMIIKDTGEANP